MQENLKRKTQFGAACLWKERVSLSKVLSLFFTLTFYWKENLVLAASYGDKK